MSKIELLEKKDIEKAIEIFKRAYLPLNVPEDEEDWFVNDIQNSFGSATNIQFYKITDSEEIICFGAVEKLNFTRGAYALRWGTTEPKFQNKGLMTLLTKHRVHAIEREVEDISGSIQIMARRPSLYKKLGFKELYTRKGENKATHMFKIINPELVESYCLS